MYLNFHSLSFRSETLLRIKLCNIKKNLIYCIFPRVPPATINLEVWISPDFDTFEKEYVKECGNVAPPGRFGWFIPIEFGKPIEQYYSKFLWNNDIQEIHWSFFLDRSQMPSFDIASDVFKTIIEQHGYNKENGQ